MPEKTDLPVSDLSLDLHNYRSVPQRDELSAVRAMIAVGADRLWGLTESLLESGFLPTENVIVLRLGTSLIVKEGNRRIAALKLIAGLIDKDQLAVPGNISERIEGLSEDFRQANAVVPVVLYDESEAEIVGKIVRLAHGKGEKAGRDQWKAVARARFNRDDGASEPGLDILEKYLASGSNITANEASQWAGDYPITVLDEAIKKIAQRLNFKNAPALAAAFPSVSGRECIEALIHSIGRKLVGFGELRAPGTDVLSDYGIPPLANESDGGGRARGARGSKSSSGSTENGPQGTENNADGTGSSAAAPGNGTSSGKTAAKKSAKPAAVATTDPRAVRKLLRSFTPRGSDREKVVALKNEAIQLDLDKTPIAFCFLMRSMFELSAYAYIKDHAENGGPSAVEKNGKDKSLARLLTAIADHIIGKPSDPIMTKRLHGAKAELNGPTKLLSVTSMNQLVHNSTFTLTSAHICSVFCNIFPLLEEMNR